MAAHRDDQAAADRELILQSGRHLGSACRHQNGIERRRFRPSHCAVADPQLDVVIAEFPEPAARRLGERGMTLDGVDAVCDPAHHRRGVARAGADFQNGVAGLHFGHFDHQRDDVGLRDRLFFADRQRAVFVGELLKPWLHEAFTRDAPHRVQHISIPHAASLELDIDHAVAGRIASRIEHERADVSRSGCVRRPAAKSCSELPPLRLHRAWPRRHTTRECRQAACRD